MEVSIKRRLVGAGVLVLFALMVLPALFDGDGRVPNQEPATIPPVPKKPDVSSLKVDLPVQARKPKEEPAPPPEPKQDVKPARAGLDSEGVPNAWSLQIGSFKNSKNAARLRDKLRDAGFRAYNKETLLSDGSVLTQVLVGPEQAYDNATELKKQLVAKSKSLGLAGPPLIVRFEP